MKNNTEQGMFRTAAAAARGYGPRNDAGLSPVRVEPPPSADGTGERVQANAFAAGEGTAVAIENPDEVWYEDWPEGLTPEKVRPDGDDEVRCFVPGGSFTDE